MREAFHRRLGRGAHGPGRGEGRGGVIEVVHRREADRGGIYLAVHAEFGRGAVRVQRVHAHDGHVGLRAGVAALGAAEAAQMGVGVEVVLILRAADDAPRRVGEPAAVAQGRIHAVEAHPVGRVRREGGHERVVRVEADRRPLGPLEADTYAVERVRDLAVAVELVAEDVRHDDDGGVYLAADALEGGLVALYDRAALPRPAGQGGVGAEVGGYAPLEVGAGAVGHAVELRVEQHPLYHAAGGGLAVRAGDHHDLQPAGEARDDVRAELEGQGAGQRGAAAPEQAQQRAGELAQQYCQK